MTMDTIIVAVIVAIAALFIARRIWQAVAKSRAAKAGCATCGCGDTAGKDPLAL